MQPTAFLRRPTTMHALVHSGMGLHCVAFVLACIALPVHGLTLGDVSVQSGVGQRLRAVVPLQLQSDEALVPECFRLVPRLRGAQDIPTLDGGRVAIERIDARTQLVVSSLRPITERSLRFTLQAGCDRAVNREYVLLIDTTPLDVPVVAASRPVESAGVPAAERAADDRAAPALYVAASDAGSNGVVDTSATVVRSVVEPSLPRVVSVAPASIAGSASASSSVVASTTVLRPTRSVANTTAPAAAERSKAENAASSTAASADALEAEAAALRKRLSGLNTMIDRLKDDTGDAAGESRRADSAQSAAAAPKQPAPLPAASVSNATSQPTPHALLDFWWSGSWPILAAFVGLAALIAAGLGWRRRRATPGATLWPAIASPAQDGAAASSTGRSITQIGAARSLADGGPVMSADAEPGTPSATPSVMTPESAARSISEALIAQSNANAAKSTSATQGQAKEAAVAVSEVSHVTEEAGVYLAFRRPERAIEVLRQHIRNEPRSLPDAWLMLLKIYRDEGRELEFRALAQEFHQQFNVQPPKWDSSQQQEDGGLADMPRLLDEIVSLWGKPQCREYLGKLLYDNREGKRTGFSAAAYEDLMLLHQLTEPLPEETFPIEVPNLRPEWAAPAKAPAGAPAGTAALVPLKKPAPKIELELPLDFELPKFAAEG